MLVVAVVALYSRQIFLPGGHSFPAGDFIYQFWAFAQHQAREMAAGRLPLWNPYAYAGSPFWADAQSGVLYPPRLLAIALALPLGGLTQYALQLEAVAHVLAAACFTYLLARRLVGRVVPALGAGIVFAAGGYLASYPPLQLSILEAAAWLPLLLYLIDRALAERAGPEIPAALRRRPAGRPLALAGVAWGMLLLAGHPQTAMMASYLAATYGAFLAVFLPAVDGRSRLAGLLATPAAVFLGLGIAAAQILPAAEYMRLSVRAAGDFAEMGRGFSPAELFQMVLPYVLTPFSPLYAGVAPLILALWVVPATRRRSAIFWGAAALIALLLSLGSATPLYGVAWRVMPGFSLFRGQERWAFVLALALALLAAYGLAEVRRRRGAGWLAVGAVVLAGLVVYLIVTHGWGYAPARAAWLRSAGVLAIAGVLCIIPSPSVRGAGVRVPGAGSGLKAALRTCLRSPLPLGEGSGVRVFALVALIAVDLIAANAHVNDSPTPAGTATRPPALVQALLDDASGDGAGRVYNEFRVWENYGVAYGLEDAWGASPLRLTEYDALYAGVPMERLWELLNVGYVLTWRPVLNVPSTVLAEAQAADGMEYAHRLAEPAPPAWLVHRVEEAGDSEAVARLADPAFPVREAALVPPGTAPALAEPPAGAAESVACSADRLECRVGAAAPALLVLSRVDYPGWIAYVDGVRAPIVRADVALQGVAVPAGAHVVRLAYRPASLIAGGVITLLSVAVALLCVIRASAGLRS